jgi:hypothetical protein
MHDGIMMSGVNGMQTSGKTSYAIASPDEIKPIFCGSREVRDLVCRVRIETSGIHPSVALKLMDTHYPSPSCDHVHYVEDDTWGGFLADTRQMSATLRILLEVIDEPMVIGGGKHAADELVAFVEHNKSGPLLSRGDEPRGYTGMVRPGRSADFRFPRRCARCLAPTVKTSLMPHIEASGSIVGQGLQPCAPC